MIPTAPLIAITREIAMPSHTLPQIAQTGSPNGAATAVGNPGIGGANNQNQPPGANRNQPNNPNSNFPHNSGHF